MKANMTNREYNAALADGARESNPNEKMGARIKTLRQSAKLTQTALAVKIGMTGAGNFSFICRLEKGLMMPAADTLAKIAKVLKTSVERLLQ